MIIKGGRPTVFGFPITNRSWERKLAYHAQMGRVFLLDTTRIWYAICGWLEEGGRRGLLICWLRPGGGRIYGGFYGIRGVGCEMWMERNCHRRLVGWGFGVQERGERGVIGGHQNGWGEDRRVVKTGLKGRRPLLICIKKLLLIYQNMPSFSKKHNYYKYNRRYYW
jgi:hypothetical protein